MLLHGRIIINIISIWSQCPCTCSAYDLYTLRVEPLASGLHPRRSLSHLRFTLGTPRSILTTPRCHPPHLAATRPRLDHDWPDQAGTGHIWLLLTTPGRASTKRAKWTKPINWAKQTKYPLPTSPCWRTTSKDRRLESAADGWLNHTVGWLKDDTIPGLDGGVLFTN